MKKRNKKPRQVSLIIDDISRMLEGFASVESFSNDAQIVRAAIQAELDAINFYEQMVTKTRNNNLKAMLLDIAREEKVHVAELEELLEQFDPELEDTEEEGEKEVNSFIVKRLDQLGKI